MSAFFKALFAAIARFFSSKEIQKPVVKPTSKPTPKPVQKSPSKPGNKSLAGIVGAGAAVVLATFVPQFEGMILRGYKDPIGIVTACAGHTKTAILGKPYTLAECNKLLDQDLASHAAGTMACIKVPTSVGERAAYVSLAYNIGTGAFCRSTLVKKLNETDYAGACAELSKWTKAGGKELRGLVRRREAEKVLCLQPGTRTL